MTRSPLLIIFLTVFIDLLGFGIVLPLLPRYGEHFDAAGWQLGLLMASFSAMQFLFAPVWGRLSDRIGRRPVLLVGLLGSTLSYAAFGWITQLGNAGPILGFSPLTWLFVSRIAAGIAGATIPTAQAYIADVTDAKSRGKGMALIGAAFGIGFTFGPILGAQFVPATIESAPSPAPGYVAAVLSAAAFLAALFLLPESLKPGSTARHGRKWFDRAAMQIALGKPYVGWVLLSVFLTTLAFAQFESTLSLLTERLGLGARANFYVFAYIGFILTLSQGFLVRKYMGKLGEFRMALAGVLLMTVGLALIGLSSSDAILNMTSSVQRTVDDQVPFVYSTALMLLYWVLPITVVGYSATTPSLQSLLSLNTSDDEQGGILGVGQSMSSLARILGPLLGLSLQDYGIAWPYWSAAALMAVCVALVCGLRGAGVSRDATPHPEPVAV
ncbi:MAG TPA: MFS transporter [Planctomycetaceae bacterium]|nr:MFS transporter [Planctomycetaceae bacterium]